VCTALAPRRIAGGISTGSGGAACVNRQVRRAARDQSIRLRTRQPSISLDLSTEHSNLRNRVDPLPLVTGHAQKIAHNRQAAVDRRRLDAPLELALNDAPDHIAIDAVQHPGGGEVRIAQEVAGAAVGPVLGGQHADLLVSLLHPVDAAIEQQARELILGDRWPDAHGLRVGRLHDQGGDLQGDL